MNTSQELWAKPAPSIQNLPFPKARWGYPPSGETAQVRGVVSRLLFGPALTSLHLHPVWGEFILTSRPPLAPLPRPTPAPGQDMACTRLAQPLPLPCLSPGTILWHLRWAHPTATCMMCTCGTTTPTPTCTTGTTTTTTTTLLLALPWIHPTGPCWCHQCVQPGFLLPSVTSQRQIQRQSPLLPQRGPEPFTELWT